MAVMTDDGCPVSVAEEVIQDVSVAFGVVAR